MRNNRGFIATGLIYSFFLIFLTLFLSVITSHIKNKISLSYVTDEIKEELNSHKTVRDFEPGDLISFVNDCTDENIQFNIEKSYVVASVIIGNQSYCDADTSDSIDITDCLVLYSYGLSTSSTSALGYDKLKEDISTGYLNATYINKIVYNFDTSNSKNYSIGTDITAQLGYSYECGIGIDEIFCNDYGKIINASSSYYRIRKIQIFNDNKVAICHGIEDAMGVIYVEE